MDSIFTDSNLLGCHASCKVLEAPGKRPYLSICDKTQIMTQILDRMYLNGYQCYCCEGVNFAPRSTGEEEELAESCCYEHVPQFK